EWPYAEGQGDDADLALLARDRRTLDQLEAVCDRLAVVLISGRPLIVAEYLANWDALVAAWLPGTEGQGVADVLFGDVPFTGKTAYTWPRRADQLPLDFPYLDQEAVLFPIGYGLRTP
ncbi:MAG: glycoside hydrolase family 3 protein, partial [Anaerolineae bacterium]